MKLKTLCAFPLGRYSQTGAQCVTDSFFAAITDLNTNVRRKVADLGAGLRVKDIVRSGLRPPVGLTSGVICPALRYCSTELGTAAATWANYLHKQVAVPPAREPKSHQCSARIPSGPGPLSRGIFRSVVGTCSATTDKNGADTGACARAGGSGSAG